jgi:hypothetical protein
MALITCEECGKSISDRASSCPHCGMPLSANPVTPAPDASPTPVMTTDSPSKFVVAGNPVTCPKCGSWQVHAEKRGWNALSGDFGSSRIFITCLKCGHRFRPGQKPLSPLAWLVIIVVVFLLLVTQQSGPRQGSTCFGPEDCKEHPGYVPLGTSK